MADDGGAGEATDFLTKKAGPLPVGVWIALVAGGLGITWYLNRGKSSNDRASTGTTGNGMVDATGSGTYSPVGGNAGTGGAGSGTGSTGNTFADNNAWGTASINYLISLGYDPAKVNSAIAGYLSSQPLTTQQQAMVNSALQHFGSPPLIPAPVAGGGTEEPPSGNSGTMSAPGNAHVNYYPGQQRQIVWTADAATDRYDVVVRSGVGGEYAMTVAGPHVAMPTGTFFTAQSGNTYTATITPRNSSGAGPVATVEFHAD